MPARHYLVSPANPVFISTVSLPNATQGSAYSTTLFAAGGIAPYTWTLISQTGSNGWSVSSAGVLTGTPTIIATDTLIFLAVDALGRPASRVLTIQTVPSGGGTGIILFLFPQVMPDMNIGVPVVFTIPCVGGSGTYIAFSGASLPPGLSFAPDGSGNGLLSGTPTTPGSFNPTLTVNDDASNFGTEVFTCNVF